jgi:hypothetical protein
LREVLSGRVLPLFFVGGLWRLGFPRRVLAFGRHGWFAGRNVRLFAWRGFLCVFNTRLTGFAFFLSGFAHCDVWIRDGMRNEMEKGQFGELALYPVACPGEFGAVTGPGITPKGVSYLGKHT